MEEPNHLLNNLESLANSVGGDYHSEGGTLNALPNAKANDANLGLTQKQNTYNSANINSNKSGESTESQTFHNNSKYLGDIVDDSKSTHESGRFVALDAFPHPALFAAFYNKYIRDKKIRFYAWQRDILVELGLAKPNQQQPYKLCLRACNGSGKDYIVICSFVTWFAACKIRSLCIITSSSGVQLTSQTENYIRAMCFAINEYHGCEVFRVRQRYIRCMWSGSEIRLFATDEEGKAEGYHPLEPDAEMAIVINEWKSVAPEITQALKRCTGYNYWIGVSTPGEPIGAFHHASTTWKHSHVVDYTQCPHISRQEMEEDKLEYGEESAWFRSKYLALFTTIGGEIILPMDLVLRLAKISISHDYEHWPIRVGIDIGASYNNDPTVITFTKGNYVSRMVKFYEEDTTRTTSRIIHELEQEGLPKNHKFVFIDDGGVGRGVSFNLIDEGWEVNRILNNRQAINKKEFGNRGAENWYRCKRIFEEELFDVSSLTERCQKELYTRRYKTMLTGARIFLESKKDAKAEGRPSPNEADSLILSLTGLTVEDYLREGKPVVTDKRPKVRLETQSAVYQHYEDNETYGPNSGAGKVLQLGKARNRIFGSLRKAMGR